MSPYIDGVLKDWGDRLFPEKVRGRRPKNIRGGRGGEKKPSSSTGPRKRLALTVHKVPEAVVKISGGGRNLGAIKAHLNYISRRGTLALEDETGALALGREELKEVLCSWAKSHIGIPEEGEHARQAFNVVLSMPPGTSRAGVREAAKAFAALEFGGNHQYVFVEHTDKPHPHVHLVVKATGRDGVRLNPRKGDLQRWREHFAGALGSVPKFDGTDVWPVDPSLLSNPTNPESSTLVYDHSSVIGSTFNTGKNQTFVLMIPITTGGQSTWLTLRLYAARVTATLSSDRKSATAGVIGGVLNTEEFVSEVKKLGYVLGMCNQSLFPNLITTVRQASDIMADGTQDPTETCDGISIGLGFEMKEVQLGGVGPAPQMGTACP